MGIFGAPVTREDDAQRALDCALEIRQRIEGLGPTLAARGLPHPDIGVGINTSNVIAGNIGSPSSLNYTVLGDGVNLASRLEGLTKRYHVPIVVGSLTREAVVGDGLAEARQGARARQDGGRPHLRTDWTRGRNPAAGTGSARALARSARRVPRSPLQAGARGVRVSRRRARIRAAYFPVPGA
jgi:hypothetical protein